MTTTIIIALGSNIGDRHTNLERTVVGLAQYMTDITVSRVHETKPCYVIDQPFFLNQVVKAETEEPLTNLILYLKRLEREIGRTKTFVNGPRIIDIDILFYGSLVQSTSLITVPHPRLYERLFVLEPICEIAPDWVCPATGQTMRQCLTTLQTRQQN